MKRSRLKRKTPLRSRSKIRVQGHDDTEEVKRRIQALLREYVMIRDGGCILRNFRFCNGVPGLAALQADHLITRTNSATYADHRLVAWVCRSCHTWKSLGGNLRKGQDDAPVKRLIPVERAALWERCEADNRPHRMYLSDWKALEIGLTAELAKLRTSASFAP